jgi:hypothetical protein
MVNKLADLGIGSLEQYEALILTENYTTRVISDSGIVESNTCVENNILNLLGI